MFMKQVMVKVGMALSFAQRQQRSAVQLDRHSSHVSARTTETHFCTMTRVLRCHARCFPGLKHMHLIKRPKDGKKIGA